MNSTLWENWRYEKYTVGKLEVWRVHCGKTNFHFLYWTFLKVFYNMIYLLFAPVHISGKFTTYCIMYIRDTWYIYQGINYIYPGNFLHTSGNLLHISRNLLHISGIFTSYIWNFLYYKYPGIYYQYPGIYYINLGFYNLYTGIYYI